MLRTRMEYGGCSLTNLAHRSRWLAAWASAICQAWNVLEPMYLILPCRTRSLRACKVSSIAVSGCGLCT